MGSWEFEPYVPQVADEKPGIPVPVPGEPEPISTAPTLKVPESGLQETGDLFGGVLAFKFNSGVEAAGNDKLKETTPTFTDGYVAANYIGVRDIGEEGGWYYRNRSLLGIQAKKAPEGQSAAASGAGNGGILNSNNELVYRADHGDIIGGVSVIASKNSNGDGLLFNPTVSYFQENKLGAYAQVSGLFGNTSTGTNDYKLGHTEGDLHLKYGERSFMNNTSYISGGLHFESTSLSSDTSDFSSSGIGGRVQGVAVLHRFESDDKEGVKKPKVIVGHLEVTHLVKTSFDGWTADPAGDRTEFDGKVDQTWISGGLGFQF